MMPGVAAISRFSAALLLWCVFSLTLYAQGPELDARTGSTKFDEFGFIRHCDLTARLDNLAIFVQETPGSAAHIIFYGPPGAEELPLTFIKDYFVNSRGLLANRIKTVYGGRNSDLKLPKIEFWLVPRNALPPEPQVYEPPNLEKVKGLFDENRTNDRLVEKWRTRLANTHKIFADRFVVLITTAPEDYSSHLRIWIVPKGQPLPDPHEELEYADDDP